MNDFIENLRRQAFRLKKRIVLPEGNDPRVVEAAGFLERESGIVPLVLTKENMEKDKKAALARKLLDENSKKGLSEKEAAELSENPLYYGAMLLAEDVVDGFVGGANSTTGDTVRALLKIVGRRHSVSGAFIMVLPDGKKYVFADCAIMPDPDPEQLADLAADSAQLFETFVGEEPRIAFLSFSTMGSARHKKIEKIKEAAELFGKKSLPYAYIGEVQLDAALVPEIARKKLGGREWPGANVLIFPDLNSGNIGYKLVERMAGASAIGPVLQGLKKPGNDLSRGCSAEDIVNVVCMTALQAGRM